MNGMQSYPNWYAEWNREQRILGTTDFMQMSRAQCSMKAADMAYQIERLTAQRDELVGLVERYRNETPVGNQPHMICHVVDELLAKIKEAGK